MGFLLSDMKLHQDGFILSSSLKTAHSTKNEAQNARPSTLVLDGMFACHKQGFV